MTLIAVDCYIIHYFGWAAHASAGTVASSDTPLQVKTGSMVNLFYKIREDSSKHRIKVRTIIHGEIFVLHRLLLPARLHSINAGVVYIFMVQIA